MTIITIQTISDTEMDGDMSLVTATSASTGLIRAPPVAMATLFTKRRLKRSYAEYCN